MPAYEETNVLVPPCALAALDGLSNADGMSRDATLRALVVAHVEMMESIDWPHRSTHISTVLRYPQPKWRGRLQDDVEGKRLRLRLPPAYIERAKAVAFRLPGQPVRGGHRDYQSRLLADIVTTAIAAETEFTDAFLDGLTPLLRHKSALGLWQLAVAATLTIAERKAYKSAVENSKDGRAQAVADRLMRGKEAWHHPRRVEVVRHFARVLLTGRDADKNELELLKQDVGGLWDQYVNDLENMTDFDHPLLVSLDPDTAGNREGRGGTAVWRAERSYEMQVVATWLLGTENELVVSPPGWLLRRQPDWHTKTIPGSGPDEDTQAHIDAGIVLDLQTENTRFVWPVTSVGGPVPELVDYLPLLARLAPVQAVETVLAKWGNDLLSAVKVPAFTAHKHGLIDKGTCDELVSDAREATGAQVSEALKAAEEFGPGVVEALTEAKSTPTVFARVCKDVGIEFRVIRAEFWWEIDTLAVELTAGTWSPDLLSWLTAGARRQVNRALEGSMQDAWNAGFSQGRARYFA